MNRVVIHWRDGRTERGTTVDFIATKDRFHLLPWEADPGVRPKEVLHRDLKGIFFVRSLEGDSGHAKSNLFDASKPTLGRKIKVVFKDGEVLVGTTQGYQPGRPGFFVIPADPRSNNERCYIITEATQDVILLP